MIAVTQPPATAPATRIRTWPLLLTLVLVGFTLRIWGITFGLPYAYHVDEALYNNVGRIVAEQGLRGLHPSFSGFQLATIAEHALLNRLWPLLRHLPLPPEVTITLTSRAESFNLLGRLTSATFGALTALPVFLLGRALWSREVGLLAALFTTLCYIHVRDSHFGVPDAMVCFLTVTAACVSTRLYDRTGPAGYLLAGIVAGLAIGTKQLAWPILVIMFLFHMAAPRDGAAGTRGVRTWISRAVDPKLLLLCASAVIVYLLCAPETVLRWKEFRTFWKATHDLGNQGGMDRLRLEDTGQFGTYLYTLWWGLGGVLTVLSAAGVAVSLVRPASDRERILMLFPLLYFGFLLAPGNVFFARYAMSGLPFLILAAAALLWRVFAAPLTRGARAAVVIGGIAAVVAQPVANIIKHDLVLSRTDTRTLAKEWIEHNIPAGSTVMLEFWWFGPFLASERRSVPFSTRTYNVMTRGAYGLSDFSDTFGPSKGTPLVDDYRSAGVEYIVSNSYSWGSHLIDRKEDEAKRQFYQSLDREAELIQEFSPYVKNQTIPRIFDETYGPATHLERVERPGPALKIYRLK